jgi:Zn-finger nucleic acid-binding protein
MTKEIRTTISPSDIVAIEFECKSCHSRFTIEKAQYQETFPKCPFCREVWIATFRGKVDVAISNMIGYLREYSDLASNPDVQLGVMIRFQLAPEEENGSR